MIRHRERMDSWIFPEPYYRAQTYCSSWGNSGSVPLTPLALRQEICDDELHPGPPYRRGGPLDLWKFSIGSPWGSEYELRSNEKTCNLCPYHYKGRYYLHPYSTSPTSGFAYWRDSDWGDASSYGATGWNKFKPIKPGVELGVALAEFRETIHTLLHRARSLKDIYDGRRKFTNPASNFLEGNFGWLPLYHDIKNAINTYQPLDDMIGRIRRMNGRWEHRGGVVDKQTESWETAVTGSAVLGKVSMCTLSSFHPSSLVAADKCTDKFQYTSKAWFEGAFRYYIPEVNTPEWADKARRKLMGLDVNPSLIWELIPWSWLVDWVSNAGDVFSNMDNGLAENLTAAYAYVMRTTTMSVERTAEVHHLTCVVPNKPTVNTQTVLVSWTRKHRVAASPFGFGIDFGSFSPKQIAIMAALGLSRT